MNLCASIPRYDSDQPNAEDGNPQLAINEEPMQQLK
jgi:hypothetical protein